MGGNTLASRTMNLNFVNSIACIELASDWFKNNQLQSERTHAHYREPVPLRNARQSHSVDCGLRCWIPVFFSGTWILDSILSGISEYLSSILDSKALDSGYHEQTFPGFWILQARITQILESGYPCIERSACQTFFGPVHAYLIRQLEIYFSSNVRF